MRIIVLFSMLVSVSVIAGTEYNCTFGKMVRKVMVQERAESGVSSEPTCEVLYDKTGEGATEVQSLWRANFNKSYCEEKAQEFVENKLKVNGWNCSIVTASSPKTPSEEAAKEVDPQ